MSYLNKFRLSLGLIMGLALFIPMPADAAPIPGISKVTKNGYVYTFTFDESSPDISNPDGLVFSGFGIDFLVAGSGAVIQDTTGIDPLNAHGGLGVLGGPGGAKLDPGERLTFSITGPVGRSFDLVSVKLNGDFADAVPQFEVFRLETGRPPQETGFNWFGDSFDGFWQIEEDEIWCDISLCLGGQNADQISSFSVISPDDLVEATPFSGFVESVSIRVTPLDICQVGLNKSVYFDGETVVADFFRIRNSNPEPIEIEVKIWLHRPIAPAISFTNQGSDGSLVLPPGTDIDLGPLPILTVSPALPRGVFELNCRVIDPKTGILLEDERDNFGVR